VKRTSYETYYRVFSILPLFHLPRSKYSLQHPVLKHQQSMLFPECEGPSFTPVQKAGENMIMYILIFLSF